MAIIKTAILQTHVYTDKFRNIIQAAELLASRNFRGSIWQSCPKCSVAPTRTNTSRNMRNQRGEIPGKNVPDWRQNTEFIS